LQFKIK